MNSSFGLENSDLDYIKNLLRKTPEIEKASIFGSRSTEKYKNCSDVDIAIEGDKINLQIVAHLKSLLEEESPMPYFFDIVDYTHLKNSTFKKIIRNTRIIFYSRN